MQDNSNVPQCEKEDASAIAQEDGNETNDSRVIHRPHSSPEPIRNWKSMKPREGTAKGSAPLRSRPGVTPMTSSNGTITTSGPENGLSPASSRHLRLYEAAKEQQAKLDALRQKAQEAELGMYYCLLALLMNMIQQMDAVSALN